MGNLSNIVSLPIEFELTIRKKSGHRKNKSYYRQYETNLKF